MPRLVDQLLWEWDRLDTLEAKLAFIDGLSEEERSAIEHYVARQTRDLTPQERAALLLERFDQLDDLTRQAFVLGLSETNRFQLVSRLSQRQDNRRVN